jgi:hypothetical protein
MSMRLERRDRSAADPGPSGASSGGGNGSPDGAVERPPTGAAATVPSDVPAARDAVRREREAIQEKIRAYEAFEDRLEAIDDPGPAIGDGGALRAAASTIESRVLGRPGSKPEAIREAFRETVRPESLADLEDDEPLEDTIAAELGPSLASTICADDPASVPPDLRDTVLAAARTRRRETQATDEALMKEASFLREAEELLDPIRDWFRRADETTLVELDFPALRDRHARLGDHLDRCRPILRARHAFVADATETEWARVPHMALAEYLYGDLGVDYPVIATTARIADACRDARRRVRRHMTRVV